MKTAFYVESYGRQVEEKALIAKIKEIWVAEGNKIKDIKDLNIYAKPEDDACYYTINGTLLRIDFYIQTAKRLLDQLMQKPLYHYQNSMIFIKILTSIIPPKLPYACSWIISAASWQSSSNQKETPSSQL